MMVLAFVLRYAANIYAFLNDDNEHYSMQWKWMINELSSARENGEKVSTITYSGLAAIRVYT